MYSAKGIRIINNGIYFLLLGLLSFCVPVTPSNEQDSNLFIDFENEVRNFEPLTNYMNTSLRRVPPLSIADSILTIYGRPKISKLWLNLDEMWDYRTDTYNFNFIINTNNYESDTVIYPYNRDLFVQSDVLYEDYVCAFCPISEEVMLNVKRYQVEVLRGVITMSQWKNILYKGLKRYKKICPNLNYLEVLNESRLPQFGEMSDEEYYRFYKASYEVVNLINGDLIPDEQIKIGGPAPHGISLLDFPFDRSNFELSNKGQQIYNFLKFYNADPNPAKRLDFISFHEYHIREKPIHLSKYESEIGKMLSKAELDIDVEIFITEIGIAPPPRVKRNIEQAIGFFSLYKNNLSNPNIKLFPWVIYHTIEQQSLVMFDHDLKLTKFGQSSSLFNLHSETVVSSESYEIDENGIGVDILATKGNGKYVIQYWNYSDEDRDVEIELTGLPSDFSELDYTINFLSPDHDLVQFNDYTAIDSSLYNTTIKFNSESSLIETRIPAFSSVLIEYQ